MSGVAVGYTCPECFIEGDHKFHGFMRDDDGHTYDGVMECKACGHMYVEEIFGRADNGDT